MPACPLGLNFVPIESTEGFFRQLSASPQVFKDPFSKVLETTRRRGVTRKESQKGFQTVVCKAPPLALQEPEVAEDHVPLLDLLSFFSPFPGSSPVNHTPASEGTIQS